MSRGKRDLDLPRPSGSFAELLLASRFGFRFSEKYKAFIRISIEQQEPLWALVEVVPPGQMRQEVVVDVNEHVCWWDSGEEFLDRIREIREGTPQSAVWHLVVDEAGETVARRFRGSAELFSS